LADFSVSLMVDHSVRRRRMRGDGGGSSAARRPVRPAHDGRGHLDPDEQHRVHRGIHLHGQRISAPPKEGVSVSGLRARWLATVIDADTVVDWVNAHFLSPAPVIWSALVLDEDFPELPVESLGFVTPPGEFIENPSLCRTAGCPQVFQFGIK